MNLKTERIDLIPVLQKAAMLSDLSLPELQMLAARLARKFFKAGEVLFYEDQPCKGMHIITQGRVRIYKTSASGREQVLAVNGSGESIAEVPVFDGGPYPASAVALDETETVFISRKDFQDFCLDHPEVSLKVLAFVGARLRQLVGIIEELSFTTIRQRLVALLMRLAQSEGKKTGRGTEFLLPGSHQELANQLGTVRELVSRNLMRLQAEGLLEVDARQIVIKDMKSMAGFLEAS
jgi:CRP/FNR family transcriptional regulator